MPEKKRNQLIKAICDKKGVTSMELAAELNVDRSRSVGRIVREAAVMTTKRIRSPEFIPELEQRQKRACRKDKGRISILSPTGVEVDPLAVP